MDTRAHACTANGIDLPFSFDVEASDWIQGRVAELVNPNDADARWKHDVYQVFAPAWVGMLFRLRAASEYDNRFRELIARSTAPTGDTRFDQERSLFGCIVSTCSAIECFFMAAYAVGASVQDGFAIVDAKDLKKYPSSVAKCYSEAFPSAAFSAKLRAVQESPEFERLGELRDALVHRGVIPRRHVIEAGKEFKSAYPMNPKAKATEQEFSETIDGDSTHKHIEWALASVNELVTSLREFLQGQRPRTKPPGEHG